MLWKKRNKRNKELKAIHTAFDLAMNGRPFMLIVESNDVDRVNVIVGEGLKMITIINAMKAISENEPQFKKALPDMLIELSKIV